MTAMTEVLCPEPGIYRLTPEQYHRDPCPKPSLSCSSLKLLLSASPLHMATEHPRLAVKQIVKEKDEFDLGQAAHTLLLGDERKFEIVDHTSWRKNIDGMPAGEWKSDVRAAGKIPILQKDYDRTVVMVEACREQLRDRGLGDTFWPGKGQPEMVIVWQEGDVWCRALLDWHPSDWQRRPIWSDYKTTSVLANPDTWGTKTAWDLGFDIQDAWYKRGIRAVFNPLAKRYLDPGFRFIVQERHEPHVICVMELGNMAAQIGHRKVEAGLKIWRDCMRAGEWPAYPQRIVRIEPPEWMVKKWLDREERGDFDGNTVDQLIEGFRR